MSKATQMLLGAIAAAEAALPNLVIPDMPTGWASAGPLGVLILVVLLFLAFILIVLREMGKRERSREVAIANLNKEHAERLKETAAALVSQHRDAMETQLAHCKEEVEATVNGYKGQVAILSQQNAKLAELVDRKLSEACRFAASKSTSIA